MRGALVAAALAVGASAARAQDATPPVDAQRRHKADPRALDLVRKADRTTYRPTAAGLKSLRCTAEYVMTNGIHYRMAYAMESPGRSTIDLRTTETGDPDPHGESDRFRRTLDDLFDGPRWERRLESYELEYGEVEGRPVVTARKADGAGARIELRFLPDGPVAEESPGDEIVAQGAGTRTRWTYDALDGLFVRRRGAYDGYGVGFQKFEYRAVDGVRIPESSVSFLAGLGGTLTISDVEVNVAVTGPAKLPPRVAAPSQEALDALDVAALVAKVREPFVGRSPDSVAMLRVVRAFAKKGDDAKKALPVLVALLGYERGEPPKSDAPPDFEDFHVPLVRLLADLRPDSVKPLIASLRSPSREQRYWAANALGLMGADGAEAVEPLLAALEDKHWAVGICASEALRAIGCPAERAFPALLRQAHVWWMGEAWADEVVAFAKADRDGDIKLVAALLAEGFRIEREEDGRIRGVEHVFRKRGARLVAELAESAASADAPRQEQIARALACTGRSAFVALSAWIRHGDADLRLAAIRAVPWAGKDAEALAADVAAQLASSEPAVVDAAEAALVAVGAPARPHVEAFVASRPATGDDAPRERATKLLRRLPS